jgi:hypothetical protein
MVNNIFLGSVRFSKPILLLVEGIDDKEFLETMIKYLINQSPEWESLKEIQVIMLQGEPNLKTSLFRAIKIHPDFSEIKTIGIVRDADSSVTNTFESLKSIVRQAGFSPPVHQLIPEITYFEDQAVSLVFLIMGNEESGMLEDLCYQSIGDSGVKDCIESYLSCVKSINGRIHNFAKSKCYAYIAVQDKPDIRVGTAAKKRYWDLDHCCFQPIVDFLSNLIKTIEVS